MKYIYLDNFRGFSNTIVPLQQLCFLVGENSTGKSSFLKALGLLSSPGFWFSPERAVQDEVDFGSFHDIVSASSAQKDTFSLGAIRTNEDFKSGRITCFFSVFTFSNIEGSASISRYIQYLDGKLIVIRFKKDKRKYKSLEAPASFANIDRVTRFFKKTILENSVDSQGFNLIPTKFPHNLPFPALVSIIQTIDSGKGEKESVFTTEVPFPLDVVWIAPIRTKPQRFYDGIKKSYTPEGDHTPFLLQKRLRTKTKSANFSNKLKAFGESSGLFDVILPHAFNRKPNSPFEIIIQLHGTDLNINNVGYGVSQALPLVVEFISRQKETTFAVQQPEVHLHPRAQASLGDLISELAKDIGHSFFIETHSDYLIDRCRLNLSKNNRASIAQVLFFTRSDVGNRVNLIKVEADGKYSKDQPPEFRKFFIHEEMQLLSL